MIVVFDFYSLSYFSYDSDECYIDTSDTAPLCVLVRHDDKFKELVFDVHGPKFYKKFIGNFFIDKLFGFNKKKLDLYNMLRTFITCNEDIICTKWNLTDKDITEILNGATSRLIESCAGDNRFKKFVLSWYLWAKGLFYN